MTEERRNRPDQRFFLLSAPALDLSFGSRSILQPIKILIEDQLHRSSASRIAVISTCFVLSQAAFKTDDCRSNVVAAVGPKQDIEVSAHRSSVLRDSSRPCRVAPQDDGFLAMASKKIRHPA